MFLLENKTFLKYRKIYLQSIDRLSKLVYVHLAQESIAVFVGQIVVGSRLVQAL